MRWMHLYFAASGLLLNCVISVLGDGSLGTIGSEFKLLAAHEAGELTTAPLYCWSLWAFRC
ncbi:hypothetical protein M758_10G052500 [Ceratodon purpureus]|nr:hypothetical protein M758_10G052500 [Ceratodon purpureus]